MRVPEDGICIESAFWGPFLPTINPSGSVQILQGEAGAFCSVQVWRAANKGNKEAYGSGSLWLGCLQKCSLVSRLAGLSMAARILEADQGKKRWGFCLQYGIKALVFSWTAYRPTSPLLLAWFLWDLTNCCICKTVTQFNPECPNLNLYIAILCFDIFLLQDM